MGISAMPHENGYFVEDCNTLCIISMVLIHHVHYMCGTNTLCAWYLCWCREKKLNAERLKAQENELRQRDHEISRREREFQQRLENEMTKYVQPWVVRYRWIVY